MRYITERQQINMGRQAANQKETVGGLSWFLSLFSCLCLGFAFVNYHRSCLESLVNKWVSWGATYSHQADPSPFPHKPIFLFSLFLRRKISVNPVCHDVNLPHCFFVVAVCFVTLGYFVWFHIRNWAFVMNCDSVIISVSFLECPGP